MLTHTTHRPDTQQGGPPAWICLQIEQTYPALVKWKCKELALEAAAGSTRKDLKDLAEHGIPWQRYEISEVSSSTTRMLMTQVQQLQFELMQVQEEMAKRV
ncbi:hypothetical protein SLEP1_g24498 [Rubroshorea leprosula]|uniref:Uncharacterized protein n=1 Tax=Rubroshorea leprosula TaxID=152421 RepID=A0AAV5JM05_9ROSI|nr:hypothetical protein SLEP1_g24498 [Rubroshorea leprosula]